MILKINSEFKVEILKLLNFRQQFHSERATSDHNRSDHPRSSSFWTFTLKYPSFFLFFAFITWEFENISFLPHKFLIIRGLYIKHEIMTLIYFSYDFEIWIFIEYLVRIHPCICDFSITSYGYSWSFVFILMKNKQIFRTTCFSYFFFVKVEKFHKWPFITRRMNGTWL